MSTSLRCLIPRGEIRAFVQNSNLIKCREIPFSSFLHRYKNQSFVNRGLSSREHALKPKKLCRANMEPFSEKAVIKDNTLYQGMYGPWRVEESDRIEVITYRAGLVTSASCFLLASSAAFLPSPSILQPWLDYLYLAGSLGLGIALFLIHIYVTPIKRMMQLLWFTGALGSCALAVNFAAPEHKGLVEFVVLNPAAVWAVGPLFASLTGLVFKEGLCYGKLEAGILTFLIPTLLLGHMSGVMNPDVERVILGAWNVCFALFAARKFYQPIKDDIGDKSVFIFQALSPAQQEELLQNLQSRQEL